MLARIFSPSPVHPAQIFQKDPGPTKDSLMPPRGLRRLGIFWCFYIHFRHAWSLLHSLRCPELLSLPAPIGLPIFFVSQTPATVIYVPPSSTNTLESGPPRRLTVFSLTIALPPFVEAASPQILWGTACSGFIPNLVTLHFLCLPGSFVLPPSGYVVTRDVQAFT